jgi:hypothetical protein
VTHTQLVKLMVGQLEHVLGEGLAWEARVGAATSHSDLGPDRFIRFGRVGQSDIAAIIPPTGRWGAVECKTGDARLTKKQREFLALVNAAGGLGLECRDTNWRDVVAQFRAAIGK